MRIILLTLALACLTATGASAQVCQGFRETYASMMAEVNARSPGLETNQRRDAAQNYFRSCMALEIRANTRTTVCDRYGSRVVCQSN